MPLESFSKQPHLLFGMPVAPNAFTPLKPLFSWQRSNEMASLENHNAATDPRQRQLLARLQRYAWLLDNSIPLPGLKYRIGWDPIIGLLPGIGDAIGALLSMVIVLEGARSGLPRVILLRMAWNIAVEMVLGTVPLLGNIFDMTWKANVRNVRLLEKYLNTPGKSMASSAAVLSAVLVGMVLLMVAVAAAGVLILGALWMAVRG
jgi:hypothetical protein